MNKARILALADHIEGLPDDEFTMSSFVQYKPGRPGGTPACIAGWAVWLWGSWGKTYNSWRFSEAAKQLLALEYKQYSPLFFGKGTRLQAVAVLHHLAATGEVDWTGPRKETEGRLDGAHA